MRWCYIRRVGAARQVQVGPRVLLVHVEPVARALDVLLGVAHLVEALGDLGGRLAKVDAAETRLYLIPAFHSWADLLVRSGGEGLCVDQC